MQSLRVSDEQNGVLLLSRIAEPGVTGSTSGVGRTPVRWRATAAARLLDRRRMVRRSRTELVAGEGARIAIRAGETGDLGEGKTRTVTR